MINWTEIVVIPPKDKWDCLAESVIEGFYKNNKNELQKIIDNGYSDVMKYHTSDKRVKYIFEKIGEIG